jgi:ribosomal protein S8
MMILQTLNTLKNSINQKKLKVILKFSKSNLTFLNFLLKNNFIAGFEKINKKKQTFLIVYLKYCFDFSSAIRDFSNYEKIYHKKKSQKVEQSSVFITEMKLKNNNLNTDNFLRFR